MNGSFFFLLVLYLSCNIYLKKFIRIQSNYQYNVHQISDDVYSNILLYKNYYSNLVKNTNEGTSYNSHKVDQNFSYKISETKIIVVKY